MTKCANRECKEEVPASRAHFSHYHTEQCAYLAGDDYQSRAKNPVPGSARVYANGEVEMTSNPKTSAAQARETWKIGRKHTDEAVYGLCLHYQCPYDSRDKYGSYQALLGYAQGSKKSVRNEILDALEKAMESDLKPINKRAEAVARLRHQAAVIFGKKV